MRASSHKFFTTILLLTSGMYAFSQNCNPTQICGESTLANEEPNVGNQASVACFDAENTSFYYFTTNNNATNTGNAVIDIANIDCPGQNGADTLYAMVVAFDQSLWDSTLNQVSGPCGDVINSFTSPDGNPISCYSDTLAMTIELGDLQPNTTYMLLVGSNQDPGLADCGFDVTINGPAVDIDACCDDQITLGESYTFTVVGGDEFVGYDWDPPTWLDNASSNSPTTFPEETVTYQVTGYVDGCEVTDLVTIFVGPPLDIYDTFTPNGDGVNDVWEIGGIQRFENAQVNVYDRWGQVVFKSLGYVEPWDGTNGGKFLPTGTYYFVIELNSYDVNTKPIQGYITLVH